MYKRVSLFFIATTFALNPLARASARADVSVGVENFRPLRIFTLFKFFIWKFYYIFALANCPKGA